MKTASATEVMDVKRLGCCVILLTTALLSGCRAGTQYVMPTPSAVGPTAAAASGYGALNQAVLPGELAVLEAEALGVMDDVAGGDWTSSETKASGMTAPAETLCRLSGNSGDMSGARDSLTAAVENLNAAVKAKKPYDALIQANRVTGCLPDFAEQVGQDTRADILRMGYITREIRLDETHRDWTAATADAAALQGVWDRLKTTLDGAYRKEIGDVQGSLDGLTAALDGRDEAQTVSAASALLDRIAALEKKAAA